MEQQLAALRLERSGTETDWNEKRLLIGNQVERLRELAEIYREEFLSGVEGVNTTSETPEPAELLLKGRRRIVEHLAEKIELLADKRVVVHAVLDSADSIQYRSASSTKSGADSRRSCR